ncbi:GntR family transcriptional regulator [Mesorhizobium sp. M6A.T.Ce.TU.002.03.1.1]|uniref:GntR family transcriptional regulator n=1 Tax=Mesorhizobium mediterraneum TaxID=43617 RepID=A0AB36RG74_9HYPH|nr:GntR family transcriptional regulator [Mesorhizobium mediterraneum]RUU30853.1 GntR family transcriptional regulator [Mesorhizobium sp. M6A.T.Ce.TU.016.01.1.1]RUU46957.1 GntR family transcriptional regulator [Mesorhizobium sp. M6A.T.Ca.TU.002.02.2.1]RUU47073.1 GntR family transcriptional regulator [Mesorhizobium sp. M6A.T.Ce.TU.002.03.1.1]RVB78599.1 GntR family transcriptional regulator [Mesorhizobium sp. M6A.T.Cr.TU.014.01.1.1]RWN27014.1 MAG: GntR family transcriptional regulator [Mesorhizo
MAANRLDGGELSGKRSLIRSGTTVDQMVRAIGDRIVTGFLRPGEKLDEASLAARFDVSRTPVREALGRLSAMGLVERRPNRGATVAVVTQEHLASMFESMAELEAICARFSAERMTAGERRALEVEHQASARLVQLAAEEDYEYFNTEFHTRLYRGAHSKHIYELTVMTRSRLAPFRRAQFMLPGRLAKSWQEHDVIVTAIMRGDGAAAGNAAKDHVSIVSEASAVFAAVDPMKSETDSIGVSSYK